MEKGTTLIELVIVVLILGILASVTLPVSRIAIIRAQEMQLKKELRTIREGIDKYKENYDKGLYIAEKQIDSTGYPKNLKELVTKKILRKIPEDPFGDNEGNDPDKWWNKLSTTDDPSSKMSNGRDVFDVKSKSEGVALDGSKYGDW